MIERDIKLDEKWRLTQAANGDAPVVSGFDCAVQNIQLEAITQAGDLFYDTDWGWSLTEFLHRLEDPLVHIEIKQRIKKRLIQRGDIVPESISIKTAFHGEQLTVYCRFRFFDNDRYHNVNVMLDRVSVEVYSD